MVATAFSRSRSLARASSGVVAAALQVSTGGGGGGSTEPTTLQTSVTMNGVTWSFYDAASGGSPKQVLVGYGAEGQPFLISDRAFYIESDVPSAIVSGYWAHGTWENPWSPPSAPIQAWDEAIQYNDGTASQAASLINYDHSKNIDPGKTGTRIAINIGDAKSFVKGVRRDGLSVPRAGGDSRHIKAYSVFHVLAEAPPLGAYMPAVAATDKTIKYTKATRNLAALGSGFTLPGSHPTLAAYPLDTSGSTAPATEIILNWMPYVGIWGEQQSRVMVSESSPPIGGGGGYPGGLSGIGIAYARLFNAMMSAGQSGFDETILSRFISFGIQMEEELLRGFHRWDEPIGGTGAGQWHGYTNAIILLGFLYWQQDATLMDRCLSSKSNVISQSRWLTSADVGEDTAWPGNHSVQCRTTYVEDVGKPAYRQGERDTDMDADYQFVASAPGFAEIIGIGAMRAGPSGWDGSQVLSRSASDFSSANLNTLQFAYYYRLRSQKSGLFALVPYDTAEAALWDVVEPTWAFTPWTGKPDAITPMATKTSQVLTASGSGQLTWDISTTAIGGTTQTVTAWNPQYSLDGYQFVDASSQTATGTQTGLVNAQKYYFRYKRQNASGWSPYSVNYRHKIDGGVEDAERLVITTGGTKTGTVTNTVAPVILARVYPLWEGPYYEVPAAGVSAVGQMLICGVGMWTGNLTGSATYQWKRNGANISGATTADYTVQAADLGSDLTCTVTWAGVSVTTSVAVGVPNFEVADLLDQAASSVVTSTTVTVGNVPAGTSVAITGGEHRKNGGSWTTGSITVSNGDTYDRRVTTSAAAGGLVEAVVTVGGVASFDWDVGTAITSFPATLFDGSTDFMERTLLSTLPDGDVFTLAMLFTLNGGDGTAMNLFEKSEVAANNSTLQRVKIERRTTNIVRVIIKDTAGTTISQTDTTATFRVSDGQILLLIAYDCNAGTCHIYKNGTLANSASTTFTPGGAATISFSEFTKHAIFASTNTGTRQRVNGDFKFSWFDDSWMDLTSSTNRDKFLEAALGSNGSGPTGSQPAEFVYGIASVLNGGTGSNKGFDGDYAMLGDGVSDTT